MTCACPRTDWAASRIPPPPNEQNRCSGATSSRDLVFLRARGWAGCDILFVVVPHVQSFGRQLVSACWGEFTKTCWYDFIANGYTCLRPPQKSDNPLGQEHKGGLSVCRSVPPSVIRPSLHLSVLWLARSLVLWRCGGSLLVCFFPRNAQDAVQNLRLAIGEKFMGASRPDSKDKQLPNRGMSRMLRHLFRDRLSSTRESSYLGQVRSSRSPSLSLHHSV